MKHTHIYCRTDGAWACGKCGATGTQAQLSASNCEAEGESAKGADDAQKASNSESANDADDSPKATSIKEFLEAAGFEEYLKGFEKNKITLDILPDLSDADLKDLGVSALGDRKKLLVKIQGLGERSAPPKKASVHPNPVLAARLLSKEPVKQPAASAPNEPSVKKQEEKPSVATILVSIVVALIVVTPCLVCCYGPESENTKKQNAYLKECYERCERAGATDLWSKCKDRCRSDVVGF